MWSEIRHMLEGICDHSFTVRKTRLTEPGVMNVWFILFLASTSNTEPAFWDSGISIKAIHGRTGNMGILTLQWLYKGYVPREMHWRKFGLRVATDFKTTSFLSILYCNCKITPSACYFRPLMSRIPLHALTVQLRGVIPLALNKSALNQANGWG